MVVKFAITQHNVFHIYLVLFGVALLMCGVERMFSCGVLLAIAMSSLIFGFSTNFVMAVATRFFIGFLNGE